MTTYLPLSALVLLATGLILAATALPYRNAEQRALPWFKQFYPRWKVAAYYRQPGPLLASLSSTLLALGAVLLVVALALR